MSNNNHAIAIKCQVLAVGGEFEEVTGPMITVLRPAKYNNEPTSARTKSLDWSGEYPEIHATIMVPVGQL